MRRGLLLLALALPTAALAGPFDGSYYPLGSEPEYYCSAGNDWTWVIRDNWIGLEEGSCRLSGGTPVAGFDALLYSTACRGEGGEHAGRMMLIARIDGVDVVTESWTMQLLRCE